MATDFLHGVEVLEIDSGPRAVNTVSSSVIGIVGTAPDAEATAASVKTGSVRESTAILFTAVEADEAGNDLSVGFVDPSANDSDLEVTVVEQSVVVSLATDSSGELTSTASAVVTAINDNEDAALLLSAANATGSDGSGVIEETGVFALEGGQSENFPLNTPVMVTTLSEAAGLGDTGTLPDAINGVYDQTGAVCVVVRVEEGNDHAATAANLIGGVDDDGNSTGVQVLLDAQSELGVTPKILIVPGYSSYLGVATEVEVITDRLKGCFILDGPNTTDADAINYRDNFGSKRFYVCDPWVKVFDTVTATEVVRPISPRAAGLLAKTDNDRGFWWSPSNNTISGIVGLARPIDFVLGDSNSRANLLNASEVTTVIQQDGYRLWGNRTCSADPKWAFLSVVRTADLINESIQRGHFWAVDRNITKAYVEDVEDSVNSYIRSLVNQGAVLGGRCCADPELNTPDQLAAGQVYFDVEFTPPTPAERITFRSHMVDDYFSEVVA